MSVATVGVTTGFSVTGQASVAVCAKNSTRSYLLVQNRDPSNSVYLCFGSLNAATVGNGILIAPGTNFELKAPLTIAGAVVTSSLPVGDVALIASTGATVQVSVTEN